MSTEKLLLAEAFVAVLNRALESDRHAIRELFDYRVECNDKLVDDPTIQVRARDGETPTLGVLGLINGLIGTSEDGAGLVCSENEDIGRRYKILKFKVVGKD